MHTDEASARSAPSRPVREELDAWARNRVDSETSLETEIYTLVPGRTLSISAPPPRVEPPFPGPQPLSQQDVCSYIVGPRDISCLKRQQLPLGQQEDLGRQFANWMWPQTPLLIYVGDHRCVDEWKSIWWTLRSARKFLRVRNAANISRQLMCHERCWSFHKPWLECPSKIAPQPVSEASVISILKLPTRDPGTGTKVSSTLPRHKGIILPPSFFGTMKYRL